jgi:starch synthase
MNQPDGVAKNKNIRVLFVASEAEPFIKVGGLGDVAGSLPKAIKNLSEGNLLETQVDIRLCIPYYQKISRQPINIEQIGKFKIISRHGKIHGEILTTNTNGIPVYLIRSPIISKDPHIYNPDIRKDGQKFTFFSLACLELAKVLGWKFDILHANDWHTALAVYMLALKRSQEENYKNTHSLITLHNLPFMGGGTENALRKFKIPSVKTKDLPSWACYQPLPMGLHAADTIVPVSPHYSHELLTPEYGYELSRYFRKIKHKMKGILNGLDYSIWDPVKDPCIPSKFNSLDLEKRERNKRALLKEFSFLEDVDAPLLIMVSRMDPQKGIDLALDGLRSLSNLRWNAIFLGSGNPLLEERSLLLQRDFPDKVRIILRFDGNLAHRLYAGGDILLMPSLYEPCGLSQMIAMRYGCVPVARATGGLVDSIIKTTHKNLGTGFLFSEKTSQAFANELRYAFSIFRNQKRWRQIQLQAMQCDFSWQKSASEYFVLYEKLMGYRL